MVQGEKQSCMTTLASSTSRTSDPAARKASYEALQRSDQSKWSSSPKESGAGGSSFSSSTKKSDKEQYGSWGPMFQNKANFASMHLC